MGQRVGGRVKPLHTFDAVRFHELVEHGAELGRLSGAREVSGLLGAALELTRWTQSLVFLPPTAPADGEPGWLSPRDLLERSLGGRPVAAEHLALLEGLEALVLRRSDPSGFERGLGELPGSSVRPAERRGEYGKVGLELAYYKSRVVTWSLALFVAAFLAMALMWLLPRGRLLHWVACGLVTAGTALPGSAIVMRCLIRGRPPVITLYETVLFVTAAGAALALFLEARRPERWACSSPTATRCWTSRTRCPASWRCWTRASGLPRA